MADKTVSVRLEATGVGSYVSELQRAGKATQQVAAEAQRASAASQAAGEKTAKSIGSGIASAEGI